MRKLKAISVAIGICMAPYQIAAATFDGSVPLLCAPIEIIECEVEGKCFSGTAESVNIPQFFKINIKKKDRPGPFCSVHTAKLADFSISVITAV